MKKLLFLLSASLLAGSLYARQLSPTEALARVKAHLTVPTRSAEAAPELAYTGVHGNLNTLYVFNNEGGGFLIVSADDDAAPLLGYSDTGSFDADAMPPAMQYWFDCYGAEIEQAAAVGSVETAATYATAERWKDIPPLVHTKWNQNSPYNDFCPQSNGRRCQTGCAATATVQVMKYHNYPLHGTGSHSYTPKNINKTLSADFGATTYNWEAMLNTYDNNSSSESKSAVATIMYHFGVSMKMEYGENESAGDPFKAAQALVKYFNYDKGIKYLQRRYFPYSEWEKIVYEELAANRPIMYNGFTKNEGHSFVCDGYQYRDGEDYFHINWGWGGLSDGYFLLTALNPSAQGIGGSIDGSGYNLNHIIICGIQPPVDGSVTAPIIGGGGDFQVSKSTYTRSEEAVRVNTRHDSYSIDVIKYRQGLKLTDDETGAVSYVQGSELILLPFTGYDSYDIAISEFPTKGNYTVMPAYQSGGKWYDLPIPLGNISTLKLTATSTKLTFSPADNTSPTIQASDIKLLSKLYPDKPFCVSATFTNTSDKEFSDFVYVVLQKNGMASAQSSGYVWIDLKPGEKKDFQWTTTFKGVKADSYQLFFTSNSGKYKISGNELSVSCEIVPAPTMAVHVSDVRFIGSTSSGDQKDPALISATDAHIQALISCPGIYFHDIVYGYIFKANNLTSVLKIAPSLVSLTMGKSITLDFSENLSDLDPNETYLFLVYGEQVGQTDSPWKYFKIDPSSGIENTEADIAGICPNPAADYVTVSASGAIRRITVIDLSGRVQLSVAGNSTTRQTVDISRLPAGHYLVRIATAQNTITDKLIVQ